MSKTERRIDDILQSGEHLLTLVNEILDMAKIESGSVQVVKRAIHLHDLMEELHRTFGMMAQQKEIDLLFEIQTGVPLHVVSDQTKVKQVLMNLIQNALKFTDDGSITVSLDESDHTLRFSVTDTGRGISKQELGMLFEPFYQKKYTDQPQGTGLGLPISKHYARMLGGDVHVESEIKRGSRFTFTLPIESEPHIEYLQTKAAEWTTVSFLNIHTLIVDDTPAHREILSDLLGSSGCTIRLASTGAEAIERWQSEKFDLILLDLRLPDMSGLDVLKQLKRHADCPPVVIISANAFEDDRRMALDSGADEFIPKPYHPHQLFDAIRRHTRTSRRQELRVVGQLLAAVQEGDVTTIDLLATKCKQEVPQINLILEAVDRFDYETAIRLLRLELTGVDDE
ncbi:histidine kinase-, DNA gyrase B-, and HSP90-like ATPase family protein [Exiguobacterium sp. S17]|nr:histidine kinase-, DNA gyrase B-, and HSP90-like ATPase family protein [Exiguobacterium sp. S17]